MISSDRGPPNPGGQRNVEAFYGVQEATTTTRLSFSKKHIAAHFKLASKNVDARKP
jgi:hypothetical protein